MNQQYKHVTNNNKQLGFWNIKILPINITTRVLKLDPLMLLLSIVKYLGLTIFNEKFHCRFLQSQALQYLIVPERFVWKQLIFYSSFVSQGLECILFVIVIFTRIYILKIKHRIDCYYLMQFFDITNVYRLPRNTSFSGIS